MKTVIAILIAMVILIPQIAEAKWISSYYRKDGTYVSGHQRSEPNDTVYDNYGYQEAEQRRERRRNKQNQTALSGYDDLAI